MVINRLWIILIVGLLGCSLTACAEDTHFRFLASGDLPYTPDQDEAFRKLLQQSESEDFDFLIHVGDFKAQSAPCSDASFINVRDLFKDYSKPVVYTPGDNEWTDCHQVGSDPIERLQTLRDLFFRDPATLRLNHLNVTYQSRSPEHSLYIENYRFFRSGVLFVVVHVVGSGNNYRPDHPESLMEFDRRSASNQAFLKESFKEALSLDVKAVAVIMHANPDFEEGKDKGFHKLLTTIRHFLSRYQKPVLCIHGDTHYYRIDKPLKDTHGNTYLHFTRMEVFGSPNVAGVVVSVTPATKEVFSFKPYYIRTP